MVKKVLSWLVALAFFVWLVTDIDTAINILTKSVMFIVGIFSKIADAISRGIDSADAATTIHLPTELADTVAHIARAVIGG
jgi:hypothetical protein